ncbi:MAG TPA: glycerophosphodiester phosphodiesterase family protein [Syntrophales bacterium]|nr:glycerophosphodiester phosphodiesterase family protein [Syntrophales bacterium]HOS77461.1 glycerophosphodiester phosphodiesterase family protein [Syntrophales bacterium]HPB69512.1 glycerophosphodiester phosphodiesterase family protein [Syntrophales bacterium]HQN25203.1 glycerophosphodiester phosphodiesterase family protein [Syntrophales bacterium]HQP27625.1 glycerophosphodiester phosphodiesterase family protein [Syntrophales bacterium]
MTDSRLFGSAFLKIAHRGYSSRYPENTLPAFEGAVAAGADMIELDVRLSRDGELVVIHDATIDRTSNGRGRMADLTLAELRRFSYPNAMTAFGRVPIPTLAEVIDRVGAQVTLNVEIKGRRSGSAGMERLIAALLRRKGAVDRVIVSAFDRRALVEMKRADGQVRTGLLYDRGWRRFGEDVRRLGVYSVHPRLSAIDAEALRWVHSEGVRVFPWVAKDRGDVDRCRAADFIDGVMVNDLALFGDACPCGHNPDRT